LPFVFLVLACSSPLLRTASSPLCWCHHTAMAESAESALPSTAVPSEDACEPASQLYGRKGLLHLREAMMPIPKAEEMATLKFLIFPSFPGADAPEADAEIRDKAKSNQKGKGKGKGEKKASGRMIQDMGRTEIMTNTMRGQWWRNCSSDTNIDVIVRESFSLQSNEIWKVPPGHYVQQAAPCEVFVSGQAQGLQRMPVLPRGWVTVDAVSVGGPKYLDPIRSPTWKVVFQSGSSKGDIVVREGLSLDSDEVSVLLFGARVEQAGPQEVLDDGIVRMPIRFPMVQQDGNRPQTGTGWVTCDATSQGGPKFFEPCMSQEDMAPKAKSGEEARGGGQARESTWDKNRTWKVVNLSAHERRLALTHHAGAFGPDSGKTPAEDDLVRWIVDGDIVEQVGHSKKVRGYMVMPVRLVSDHSASGWVTRRLVDRARDGPDETWFVELRGDEEVDRDARGGRKPRQRRGDD